VDSLIVILRRRSEKRAGVLTPVISALAAEESGEDKAEPISTLFTPTTAPEIGLAGGLQVGVPYLVGRTGFFGTPLTMGQSAAAALGPAAIPFTAATDIGGTVLAPLSDPAWRSDRAGYLESVGHAARRNLARFGEAAEEARRKYGPLGIPLQALYGVLNPVTGLGYALSNIYDTMAQKRGEAVACRAESAIRAALEE
jgi:hypothetical protein